MSKILRAATLSVITFAALALGHAYAPVIDIEVPPRVEVPTSTISALRPVVTALEPEPISDVPPPGTTYRTIRAEVTAYCACRRCNGKYSAGNATQTASGMYLYNNPEYADKYCAATRAVGKLGTKVEIDGIVYTIVDRMGRKDGLAVDIFIPGHAECKESGRRRNKEIHVYG